MTATQTTREMTFGEAINDALDVALASDPTVFLLGEDIADPPGGVVRLTKGLSTKYGTDRVRATPISEQAIAGAAIGAALGGLRPVAEIKPALKRAWEKGGGSVTEPELTEYAQMIDDGTKITFEAGQIQW